MSLRAHYRGHIFDFLVPPVNLSVLPVGLANFSVVGALGAIGRAIQISFDISSSSIFVEMAALLRTTPCKYVNRVSTMPKK